MVTNKRFAVLFTALCAAALMLLSLSACSSAPSAAVKSVDAGTTWEVPQTTNLTELTIGENAKVTAPEGKSVTLTVNGVETGIAAGTYKGDVVLTVTDENIVKFQKLEHHFREALYLDATGLVASKSVLAAAGKYSLENGVLSGVDITSVGENFNGIYVTGGDYTVKSAKIDFTGNGGNDFAGYGAAVMSTGKGTTLVLDGADVKTKGAVRTACIADNGSNLIVKNSTIAAQNGVLPDDYVSNVTPGEMKDVPWMLGLSGNCRATNLLGNDTTATYINSSISAEGWGVLSIDNSQKTKLTAINSKVTVTGVSGYGTYAIGDSTNAFYGCNINVADYAAVIRGGLVIYGASTPETLAALNTDLKLGLTDDELGALKQTDTTIYSKRFGVMWHGQGSVKVQDDTVINTEETVFLDKGQTAEINVDGSKGAQLNSKSGVILQIMDDDDPGPVTENGVMVNKGVYHEPTEAPVKAEDFDTTAVNSSDVVATFANISLKGDFYNAITGGAKTGADAGPFAGGAGGPAPGAPGGSAPAGDMAAGGAPGGGGPGGGGGMPGGSSPAGKNLVLNLQSTNLTGMVTASKAKHGKSDIGAEDYKLLGEVTNTPCEAVNNGVIVSLDAGSTWTVTGNSYLTSLTIADGATLTAPEGQKVTMTVNGKKTAVKAGTYKGNIVITVTGA